MAFYYGDDIDPDDYERKGVVFQLFPGDPDYPIEIQRAPQVDLNTRAPDEAAAEIIDTLEAGSTIWAEAFGGTEKKYYRFRHNRKDSDPSPDWTAWYEAERENLHVSQLPPRLPGPRVDFDLKVQPADGQVDLFVDGARQVRSVRYASSTLAFPARDTGTAVDTDGEGDVDVDDAFQLSPGQTGFVTVTFYAAPGGEGRIIGALRRSVEFSGGQTSGAAPSLSVVQTSAALKQEDFEATGSEGPGGSAAGLELRYREREIGKDWGDWQPTGANGWEGVNPLSLSIDRVLEDGKEVEVQVRDTSLAGSPVGEHRTLAVKPILALLDLPPLARGPLAEDYGRDGFAGEVPGSGRQKGPLYSRGGSEELISTVNRELRPGLLIGSGVKGSDGARTGPVNKITERGTNKHTDPISFGATYENQPLWQGPHGYLTFHPDLGATNPQVPKIELLNPSPSGGELKAVLEEVVSGNTPQSAAFSADTHGDVGVNDDDYSADQGAVDAAWDNLYTFQFDITAFGGQQCLGDECWCTGSSFTVGAYINDGSGPELQDTYSHSASCADSTIPNATLDVSNGNLPDSGIGGKEFWMGAESSSGGSYSADEVRWETGGNPTTRDATEAGDYPVRWSAYAKDDG